MKIEGWYRFNADESTPFKQDHMVGTYNTNDSSTGFRWLDEEHSAFCITLQDSENSRFKNSLLVVFTLGENGTRNNCQATYTYLHDKWDLYKGCLISDNVMIIDNWYRFNASDDTPFHQDHSIISIVFDDTSSDFTWLDDSHSVFSITISDYDNTRLSEPSTAIFSIE